MISGDEPRLGGQPSGLTGNEPGLGGDRRQGTPWDRFTWGDLRQFQFRWHTLSYPMLFGNQEYLRLSGAGRADRWRYPDDREKHLLFRCRSIAFHGHPTVRAANGTLIAVGPARHEIWAQACTVVAPVGEPLDLLPHQHLMVERADWRDTAYDTPLVGDFPPSTYRDKSPIIIDIW